MQKMMYLAAPAAAMAACASAYAVDEVVFEPSQDSYNWIANQPHGDLPYLELFQENSPRQRESVAMMAFDLSSLSNIDPADIVSARLEVRAGYAGNYWGFDAVSGELSLWERDIAFDEIDPNPSPSSIGAALDMQVVGVGNLGVLTLDSAALLAEVRDWAVNPTSNYGLDVRFSAAAGVDDSFYMALYSSEFSDPAMRPHLVVGVDNVPTPGVGALLGTGLLCLNRRRRNA
jgi:hypothetical protein